MSKVNREWSKLVGEASQMKKIKLVIDKYKRKPTPEIENMLTNSERKYQNIKATVSDDSEFLLSFLAQRAGSWKFVHLNTSGSISQKMLHQILQIIETSVEGLSIIDGYFYPEEPLSIVTKWTFPQLKSLVYAGHRQKVFKYFVNVTSLDTFYFRQSSGGTKEATSDLKTIMRLNTDLTALHAETDDIELLQNSSELKFKLQKLRIDVLDTQDFLVTQSPSLKTLDIQKELSRELLELVLGMPKLTSLAIDSISTDEFDEIPVNSKITSLGVGAAITAGAKVKSTRRIAYHKLINAMPSLKHIKCNEIDDELLLLLAIDVPDLVSIETGYFNVIRVPERTVFPNLKKFTASKFRASLQEPTGNHNFAKLVKRAKRLCINVEYSDVSDEYNSEDDDEDYDYGL